LLCLIFVSVESVNAATGEKVDYDVGGNVYEGYFVSPSASAPLVLLVHDWDGSTDYEVKRAHMLATPCLLPTCLARACA
tara:strand:- start:215 stop:451 length:237 start_codon:yes stop_codon:yes gene_type:complete